MFELITNNVKVDNFIFSKKSIDHFYEEKANKQSNHYYFRGFCNNLELNLVIIIKL